MANSERVRSDEYGPATPPVGELPSASTDPEVTAEEVARLMADGILANRLYVIPHSVSRGSIRRRFERIDHAFEEQAAEGWTH